MWYLANDMQFFIFLPIICLIYRKSRISAYLFNLVVLAFGIGSVFILSQTFELGSNVLSAANYSDLLYIKPWARCPAYVIGLMFGMMYYEFKNVDKFPELGRTLGNKFFRLFEISDCMVYSSQIIGFSLTTFFVFIQHMEYVAFPERSWS